MAKTSATPPPPAPAAAAEFPHAHEELPPPPEVILWSFHYDGPIAATDDRFCDLCSAVVSKRCGKDASRHGSNQAGCSSCDAAKLGRCHNHCGLEAALAGHTDIHAPTMGLGHAWDHAKKAISELTANAKSANRVAIHADAIHNPDTGHVWIKFAIDYAVS